MDGLERILTVFGIVAGCNIKLFGTNMRGNDQIVSVMILDFFKKVL